MIHDALASVFVAVNWIAIGAVMAAGILASAVLVLVLWIVIADHVRGLRWLARREAAQAAEREPDMPIPLCGGARPPAKAR